MTVREQEIEFPSQGLVFVSGVDESTQFESIGSGKTSLGEALCIAVCGIRGRYATLGHYSTNEKGNTLVRVEGNFQDKDLTIEMGYKYNSCLDRQHNHRGRDFGRPLARTWRGSFGRWRL